MGRYKVSQSIVAYFSDVFNTGHLHVKQVYLNSRKVFKESQVEGICLVLN